MSLDLSVVVNAILEGGSVLDEIIDLIFAISEKGCDEKVYLDQVH